MRFLSSSPSFWVMPDPAPHLVALFSVRVRVACRMLGGKAECRGPPTLDVSSFHLGLVPSLGHLYWLDPFFGGKMCEMKKATHLTAGSLISLKSQVYVSPKAGLRFFSLLYPWDDESDIFFPKKTFAHWIGPFTSLNLSFLVNKAGNVILL